MSTANGTFDAGTGNHFYNCAGECKVGAEGPVARGDWHQAARAVDERGHFRGSDLDGLGSRDFQVPGGVARNDLLGTRRAVAYGDILCGVAIGVHGEAQARAGG